MIHLTVQQLSASLDGALTGPSLELVVRHLAACHECRDRQARLAKHDDALRRLLAQEPSDVFLDDLTRRAEALATAIARGIPAPIMVTSVPLLHEEDPYAPVEPPPLPPRPELGRSGELAKEAGWGRIGVKPSAPAQVPHSDPEEARRLLEAHGSGHHDDFTELGAHGGPEHGHVDGPVFDLPAWIKDQAGRAGARSDGPRAVPPVPRVDVFFEPLDEHASDVSREAVNEAFRNDTPPARPAFEDGTAAPDLQAYAPPEPVPARPEPILYEPPGWHPQPAPGEYTHDAAEEWNAPHAHDERSGHGPGGSAPQGSGYATAGWHYEPGPPVESSDAAWGTGAIDPATFQPADYRQPIVGEFGEYPAGGSEASARSTRPADRLMVVALVTVGALILILLALQLAPAGPRHATHTAPRPAVSVSPPAPASQSRPATKKSVPTPPKARLHTAGTQPSVDQIVPPLASPDPSPETESHAPLSGSDDAVTSPPSHSTEPAAVPVAPKPAHTATRTATKPLAAGGGALSAQHTTQHAAPNSTPAAVTPPPATPAPAPAASAPVVEPEAAAPSAATSDEAQWPLLCGQIEDDAGQPVSNARVSMAEISFATRTDARGRFCVSAPAGAHSLFIEASGFTPRREPVTLSSSATDVHIRLQPAR